MPEQGLGVSSSGDTAAQWAALDGGVGLVDANERRTLIATGEERADFLHGQTSNDIRSLAPGRGCATLVLTAQGRPLALTAVYNDGDSLLLVSTDAEVAATRSALERFLVADDCEFEEGPQARAFALIGPGSAALLEAVGIAGAAALSPWGIAHGVVADQALIVLARGDLRVPSYELCVADEDGSGSAAAGVRAALETAGARPCGPGACEIVRVESGTARYGVDVDETRIAMEARLEWAIHFAKGCYVGQEVIERAVSRGRVNHQMALLGSSRPIPVGARVDGGSDGDIVTSAVVSPRLGPIALGYLPRDRADVGADIVLHSDGDSVAARVLPWPRPLVLAGRS